jgi:hypothetical protein
MTDAKQSALSDITRTVMSIVDSWGLQVAEMQRLLDLPENVRARAFNKFPRGAGVPAG